MAIETQEDYDAALIQLEALADNDPKNAKAFEELALEICNYNG